MIDFINIEIYNDLPTVFGDGENFYSLYQDLQNIRFSLDKIKSYVFDENEVDKKVSNMEDRLKILEKMAVSPKNFKCKYKDKKEIKYG